ncbi:class I SAM-dependent methyltransferase [Patescibacteria group bacterium]
MDTKDTRTVYNEDVIESGGYLYTGETIYSAVVATRKQTDEIHQLIKDNFPKNINILDIGCGDGKYTLELMRALRLKKIVGFDISDEGIKIASKRLKTNEKKIASFTVGDAYQMSKKFKKGEFDLGVIRGVLHHMEEPKKAIREVSKVLNNVIVLEPNGYNPVLKVIEKLSPYHKKHGEKSYFPVFLDKWFLDNGYKMKYRKYFSIVPYFCPDWMVKVLKVVEPFFESLPLFNKFYCGGILILYSK